METEIRDGAQLQAKSLPPTGLQSVGQPYFRQ
jgi:hypothetical protein